MTTRISEIPCHHSGAWLCRNGVGVCPTCVGAVFDELKQQVKELEERKAAYLRLQPGHHTFDAIGDGIGILSVDNIAKTTITFKGGKTTIRGWTHELHKHSPEEIAEVAGVDLETAKQARRHANDLRYPPTTRAKKE